jgi:hypothetical protein
MPLFPRILDTTHSLPKPPIPSTRCLTMLPRPTTFSETNQHSPHLPTTSASPPITPEYRFLLSRASTQRLHSPSLLLLPSPSLDTFAYHEFLDWQNSKANILQDLYCLGVSWGGSLSPHSLRCKY